MGMLSKFLTPAILLLLTLAFGVWLSLSGKPYNGILFNIHKLIALTTVVVTVILLYRLLKGTPLPVLPIVLIFAAGLCVLALFFTGAMMSAGKLDYPAMLAIHRIAIILMVIVIAGSAYFLSMNYLRTAF
jgi:hypothetical protein